MKRIFRTQDSSAGAMRRRDLRLLDIPAVRGTAAVIERLA